MFTKAGGDAELQYSKRLRSILVFFVIFTVLGLIAVLVYGCLTGSFGTCMIWALACLVCGAAIGFLFGIPKILQGSKPGNGDKETPDYQMHVNTNLTEISDWLTKIIVGLGLVKLTKLPPYLTAMAASFSDGINDKNRGVAMAFGYGTICFFSTLGFLFGYLFTRLFLSKALSIADQDSLQQVKGQLEIQIANLESKQGLFAHSLAQEGTAPAAAQRDLEASRPETMDTLVKMADEYMDISIPDWAERTRAKDAKANDMGVYALKNGITAQTIFEYMQSHPPASEGLVIALATLVNINPHQSDVQILLLAGLHLTRLHVRYRVLLAIVTLQKKGFIEDKDKPRVIDLVSSYKEKADGTLLQQIDHTLSFLNS
ncbi:MAG: hypothetical protein JST42_23115 [Bacteroidetes bacterium]|nr:hypothetical protein [Bacteroidota bacterium]